MCDNNKDILSTNEIIKRKYFTDKIRSYMKLLHDRIGNVGGTQGALELRCEEAAALAALSERYRDNM